MKPKYVLPTVTLLLLNFLLPLPTHAENREDESRATETIIANIQAPNVSGMDVNPLTRLLYASNFGLGTVSVIREQTNTVAATITVGPGAAHVAVNPLTDRVYVADSNQSLLFVANGRTNSVITTIPISNPLVVAVNLRTNEIYVSSQFNDNVTVIDGQTNTIKTVLPILLAAGIGVNPFTNRVYVGSENLTGSVFVIDGAKDTIIAQVPTGGSLPTDVKVDVKRNLVYVANFDSNTLGLIDGRANKLVKTIPVGSNPGELAIDPFTNRIYVTRDPFTGNGSLQVISGRTQQVIHDIPMGFRPLSPTIDVIHHLLYVARPFENEITVVGLPDDNE